MLKFIDTHANAISALGTVASAVAAMVALFIAWTSASLSRKLLDENKILHLAGSDPEVIVYLQTSEKSASTLSLVIENAGSGPAFNVQLRTNLDQDVLKKKHAFFRVKFGEVPITAITQNNRVSTLFGQGFYLLDDEPLEKFECTVSYSNIRQEIFVRKFTIDVRQFMHMGKLTNDDLADAAKSLSNISGNLQSIISNGNLNVVTSTSSQFREEQIKIRDEMLSEYANEQPKTTLQSYQDVASVSLRKFKSKS